MDGDSRSAAIAVAPNGARRTKADHPGLPISPDEMADTAAAVRDAGAGMVHVHVRDAAGNHSLDPELYRQAIAAIRAAVGHSLIVQITTEAVGRYAPAEQMRLVRDLKPEAVSLALRELCPDAAAEGDFAEFLLFLGREQIAPQFILYDPEDVARLAALVDRGIVPFDRPAVLYVLGRYSQVDASVPADLLPFLERAAGRFADFMACAFGRHEAACGVTAALLGSGARVGFENNLRLPNGTVAPDNAALVRAVLDPLERLGYQAESADAWRSRMAGN